MYGKNIVGVGRDLRLFWYFSICQFCDDMMASFLHGTWRQNLMDFFVWAMYYCVWARGPAYVPLNFKLLTA